MSMELRFKAYEASSEQRLPTNLPVVLRADGRKFSTYTKRAKYEKPFDSAFRASMVEAARALLSDITNARLAYVQSDEISILVYPKYVTSEPWFSNRIQKMCSIASGVATAAFMECETQERRRLKPHFDVRAFVLPPHEAPNYFWWRQSDAMRNAVSMAAETLFPRSALEGVNTQGRIALLTERGYAPETWSADQRLGTTLDEKGQRMETGKFLDNRDFFAPYLEEPTMPPI